MKKMQKGGGKKTAPQPKKSGSGYVPGVVRPSTAMSAMGIPGSRTVKKAESAAAAGVKSVGKAAYGAAKSVDDTLDKSATYRGIKKDVKKAVKAISPFKKGGSMKKK